MAPSKRSQVLLVVTAAALVFSRVFGLSVVLPGFREHYESFASPFWVGVAFTAYAATLALMQLPLGILSDRIGRRPVLVLGSVLFVAGSAWAATAESISVLIAARLLQGMGAIGAVAMASVGDTIPAHRRTMAMAMVGIPAGMGFMAGIAAAPLLTPSLGVPGLFWVTAGLGLVAGLPLAFVSIAPPEPRAIEPLGRPEASLAVAGFTLNFALAAYLWFLPDASPQALLPPLFVALVVMGGASRAVDGRGLTWQPLAGLVLLGVASWLTRSWLFVGAALFFSVHATLSAVIPSQVSRVAGARGGRGHGVQGVIAYMGTFVAGPVVGALTGFPVAVFAIMTALGLVAALLAKAWLAPQSS